MHAHHLAEPDEGDPFSAAERQFSWLVGELRSEERLHMDLSDLEELLDKEGRELLRRLLQGNLDIRSKAKVKDPVVGSEGEERETSRQQSRTVDTLFGEVESTRERFYKTGLHGLAPLDAELNLPPEKASLGVQRRVAEEVARGSCDSTVEAIKKTTGAKVAKRQAEETAKRAAVDFDEFYQQRKAVKPSRKAKILVTTFDGKGVVMRPQDLREGTKKKAQKAQRKIASRLSPGEKANRKRMACVAAVYSIAPFVRNPEDIVRDLEPVKAIEKPKRPKPEGKRVWASLKDPPEAVIAAAYEEARTRDPRRTRRWVTLVDGNDDQIKLALAYQDISGVDVTIIVDLIHVSQYLWKAAMALHGGSNKAAETWQRERLLRVLRGEASQVAAGMRRSATKRGLAQAKRVPIDVCANYLLKYKRFLRYDEYLAAGYPIATGVIEGACRHLVGDRMDVPGQWSLEGAEAVLRLRALRCSGDFDSYWRYHEQQELHRNHLQHYDGETVPEIESSDDQVRRKRRRRGHLRVVK